MEKWNELIGVKEERNYLIFRALVLRKCVSPSSKRSPFALTKASRSKRQLWSLSTSGYFAPFSTRLRPNFRALHLIGWHVAYCNYFNQSKARGTLTQLRKKKTCAQTWFGVNSILTVSSLEALFSHFSPSATRK